MDIDLYAPGDRLAEIVAEAGAHLAFAPKHEISESWDITYMAMFYGNQKIEIGDGDDAKIFDPSGRVWRLQKIDYANPTIIRMFDLDLPIMPIRQLMEYKRLLSRDVDLQDLAELSPGETLNESPDKIRCPLSEKRVGGSG